MSYKLLSITYSAAPDDEPNRIERAVREGLKVAARHWHRNFAQKHFTTQGDREYDYQPRTKQYMIRKARKKGNQLPLVWSGSLRSMVLGRFPEPRIRRDGETLRCALILRVPKYTFYTKTKSGSVAPKKYEELITTSGHEAAILQQMIEATTNEIMNQPGRRSRTILDH